MKPQTDVGAATQMSDSRRIHVDGKPSLLRPPKRTERVGYVAGGFVILVVLMLGLTRPRN
jgi:hypothetical protein